MTAESSIISPTTPPSYNLMPPNKLPSVISKDKDVDSATSASTPAVSRSPVYSELLNRSDFLHRKAETAFRIFDTVGLIGAPIAVGQTDSGVILAPDALRDAGLQSIIGSLGLNLQDHGNDYHSQNLPPLSKDKEEKLATEHQQPVQTSDRIDRLVLPRSVKGLLAPSAEYYEDNMIIRGKECGEHLRHLFHKVKSVAWKDQFVLTVGGDHSVGFATVTGMLDRYPNLRVIWIDAHGDCNTPLTSPSKLYHGMPLAHAMGWFAKRAHGFDWTHSEIKNRLPETHLGYIGLRDIDDLERQLLHSSDICSTTMHHVDRYGACNLTEKILNLIDPDSDSPIHVSLDIDSCDPSIAPGTGTTARGGLWYREVHVILEAIASTRRLVSMDLVEVNPVLDRYDERHHHGDLPEFKNKRVGETAQLGLGCIRSALGATIL